MQVYLEMFWFIKPLLRVHLLRLAEFLIISLIRLLRFILLLAGRHVCLSCITVQDLHFTWQHHWNLHPQLIVSCTVLLVYPRPQHIVSQLSPPSVDVSLHTLLSVPSDPVISKVWIMEYQKSIETSFMAFNQYIIKMVRYHMGKLFDE